MPSFRINEQITSQEVRVIDETIEEGQDKNLGVMKTIDAINLAREKNLDLVEISADSEIPVAKIVSYDKFRYQQMKKDKLQQKAKGKSNELRRIRITPRAASNDLEVKLKKVLAFLEKGDKVEIQLFLKGREKANKDFAKGKLQDFLNSIDVPYKVTGPIKYAGRGFVVQILKS